MSYSTKTKNLFCIDITNESKLSRFLWYVTIFIEYGNMKEMKYDGMRGTISIVVSKRLQFLSGFSQQILLIVVLSHWTIILDKYSIIVNVIKFHEK